MTGPTGSRPPAELPAPTVVADCAACLAYQRRGHDAMGDPSTQVDVRVLWRYHLALAHNVPLPDAYRP